MPEIDETTALRYILTSGMLLAITFFAAGFILIFIRNGGDGFTLSQVAAFHSTTGTINSNMLDPAHFFSGLVSLDGVYYIAVGLWVLIFTPVSVIFTIMATYIYQKEPVYTVISILVLVIVFLAIFVIRI